MKVLVSILVLLSTFSTCFATKYELILHNQYSNDCAIKVEVVHITTKGSTDVRNYSVEANGTLNMEIKIKKNEAIKITGSFNSDISLYEINLDPRILIKEHTNNIYLKGIVKIGENKILSPSEIVESINNDDIQKFINDSLQYNPDRFPALGSFLFLEEGSEPLPNYVDHDYSIDKINVKSFIKHFRISKSNSSGMELTFGQVANLYAALHSDQMLDYYWKIDTLYVQRWKPNNGQSVYDLLTLNSAWYETVYDRMKSNLEDISKFKLYFINAQSVIKGLKQGNRVYTFDSVRVAGDASFSISDNVIGINAFGQWVTTSDFIEASVADNLPWKVYVQDLTNFVHNQIIRDNMVDIMNNLNNQLIEINQEMSRDTTRLLNSYKALRNSNFFFSEATPAFIEEIVDRASRFDYVIQNTQNLEKLNLESVLAFYSEQELSDSTIMIIDNRISTYNNSVDGLYSIRNALEDRIENRTALIFRLQQSSVQYGEYIKQTIMSNARSSKELDSEILALLAIDE